MAVTNITKEVEERRNVDTLVMIAGWAAGYRDVGFPAESSMKQIVDVLEKQGYLALPKAKKKKQTQ